MVNYNNGKIYKIENNVDNMIYIGSTTKQYLSQRMVSHRTAFKRWKRGEKSKVMAFEMFDKHGIENCKIVLLELVNCNTNDELLAREAFYIKSLVCVNKNIPLRTQKEYNMDNKEKLRDYHKEYYNDNKEKISDYSKKYQENNKEKLREQHKIKYTCDCCSIYDYSHKSQHSKTKRHISFLETISK